MAENYQKVRPLVDGPVLLLYSGLAKRLGDEKEALILAHVHSLLEPNSHEHDGRPWCYNTYGQWADQMGWAPATAKRKIFPLEGKGLLIAGNFNFRREDRAKWYTIDCEY